MSQNVSILNQNNKYIEGFQCIYNPDLNVINISPGQAKDSKNYFSIISDNVITINPYNLGINGIDEGILPESILCSIYLIADSSGKNPVAGIISSSQDYPWMPKGYDCYRKISYLYHTSSYIFDSSVVIGSGNSRSYYYNNPIQLVSGGISTEAAFLDMTLLVPVTVGTKIILSSTYIPTTSGNVAYISGLLPLTDETGEVIYGQVDSVPIISQCKITVDSSDNAIGCFYSVTSATDSLTVYLQGFEFFV